MLTKAEKEIPESAAEGPYAPVSCLLRVAGEEEERLGSRVPAFTVSFRTPRLKDEALSGDLYATAVAYVRGDIDVRGDQFAAARFFLRRARTGWRQVCHMILGWLSVRGSESFWQLKRKAVENVRRHYDQSNDFYRQFLDRGMTYSCAYFEDRSWGIEEAQEAKLRHILRKLDVRRGDRFLDIGCGWGALAEAAARLGAVVTGCTLSRKQFLYARERLSNPDNPGSVLETNYLDLAGKWDKIASIGMFEHVGRQRLPGYFRKVYGLLGERGLFLNHGIVRPEGVKEGAETLFLRRRVFPGTELPHLGELIRDSEEAGFEVLDVENLRAHYALTCRAWVLRLLDHAKACREHVSNEVFRTWVLYLSACGVKFETGELDVYQTLLAKRSPPSPRRLTRDYMYGGPDGDRNTVTFA